MTKRQKVLGVWQPPVILDLNIPTDRRFYNKILKNNPQVLVVDEIIEQYRELFLAKHPKKIFTKLEPADYIPVGNLKFQGVWIYYPWRFSLVHCLSKKDFCFLKTVRNKNLILPVEQKKMSKLRIGVAGLNVGNPGAVCAALAGLGMTIKLADIDPLSVSNLNRFRAGLCDLGVNKAMLSARQIAEINPFIEIKVFNDGIKSNELDFFLLRPKLDILVEEMDNLELKIAIRERARFLKIPVIMVTGNGENVIIDIERYDLDQNIPLLNGLLPADVYNKIKNGRINPEEKVRLAKEFMGKNILDERLENSFAEVGKTIAGIPQLAESSFLRGSAIAHCARLIATGAAMPSGRYEMRWDNILRRK